MTVLAIFHLLSPDFSLILGGLLLSRLTPLSGPSAWAGVEKLIYFVLFPALLFQSIVQSPLQWGAAAHFMLAGLLLSLTLIVLTWVIPFVPRILPFGHIGIDVRDHAACAQIGFRFNSFVMLSLTGAIAGVAGQQLVAMLIGLCVPLCNAAAVWPMARHAGTSVVRELLRNPLLIATLAGLLCNLLGLRAPDFIQPGLTRLGQAALALGLLAAGAGMRFGALKEAWILGATTLAIKHVLAPLWAFALASVLQLSAVQALVLLIFAASPTANSAYVLASRMGYNAALVASLVTLSIFLALFSYPLGLMLTQCL